ncbi:MAG: 23S rRNA (adenine(2503)-C(2))-methyltransferase RlmN, partial [Thermodesulfobacteriota bacterium]
WIYIHQADSFDVMSDLGKKLRETLDRHFSISRLGLKKTLTSKDGTRKYLFELSDKTHIESVLIPERDHTTLCISSQVGCAQRCAFCLTGRGGFFRNLTTGEIVSQVRDIIKDTGVETKPANIVFMGMGEPLANYRNLVNAIRIITDNAFGLKFSNRKVTVSTAGLVPQIQELGHETKVNLAVSLNATVNSTRSMLMPINRKYPLEQLLDACRKFPLPPTRRITFEYILIKGINDSPEDARRLVKLLSPIRAKINLILFNEFEGSGFVRPDAATVNRFQEILFEKNMTAVIRKSKGQDICAACGQLSTGSC